MSESGKPSLSISPASKRGLYAASKYLTMEVERSVGLHLPCDVYLQDPLVAAEDPKFGFADKFYVRWEPGLSDGPTSARFAVVDYNADTGHLAPPAVWDEDQQAFLAEDKVLDRHNIENFQFHQVNVWATLQRALDFFEQGQGLGRPIPWGFEGNRLIVVPHAGYGQNAFYDRRSKSLQFYYFGPEERRVYTCLSTDIINHEFGHAVLDGIRPHYSESSTVQAAAFHEFLGDLTSILIILRNNDFRGKLAETTAGDLSKADHLAFIAEQFGRAVEGNPYLRSATNALTLDDVAGLRMPHFVSQVLVGTMYEILLRFAKFFLEERGRSPKQAFWDATQRMQRTAIQPLDLLPPVDVTFKDYALAVLRAEELANPIDPHGYYQMMLEIFRKRGILDEDDEKTLLEDRYLYQRLDLGVFHDVDDIARSRAAAYRFLHDNRDELMIPRHQDFVIADLYDAKKLTRQGLRLPRQIILEYLWHEDVALDGTRFGEMNGETTTLPCGGTLVFNDHGNLLSWFRKPGTEVSSGKKTGKKTKHERAQDQEKEDGEKRRAAFLDDLAAWAQTGQLAFAQESEKGLLGSRMPPITARREAGRVKLELTPHLSLTDSDRPAGARQWEISF